MPAYAYTTTIDLSPQKICNGRLYLDLDMLSVSEAIKALQSLSIPSDCVESRIDIDTNNGYSEMKVFLYRMETSEETQERVTKAQAYNKITKDKRKAEYEKLKQEFDKS